MQRMVGQRMYFKSSCYVEQEYLERQVTLVEGVVRAQTAGYMEHRSLTCRPLPYAMEYLGFYLGLAGTAASQMLVMKPNE